MESILRAHAEQQFAAELYELEQADRRPRPTNWRLSPWAVATYILGGTLDNGFEIAPKYIGNGRLIEIAIATLTTDRALLLMGIPGTGKTWVSEHLAAAISGARYVEIKEAGHMAPLEKPAVVNAAIQEFLADVAH